MKISETLINATSGGQYLKKQDKPLPVEKKVLKAALPAIIIAEKLQVARAQSTYVDVNEFCLLVEIVVDAQY